MPVLGRRPALESRRVEPAQPLYLGVLGGVSASSQLKLDWPASLLLHHCSPRSDPTTTDEIANPNYDDGAAPQFAIDGAIK
jgi:hypothetical protein